MQRKYSEIDLPPFVVLLNSDCSWRLQALICELKQAFSSSQIYHEWTTDNMSEDRVRERCQQPWKEVLILLLPGDVGRVVTKFGEIARWYPGTNNKLLQIIGLVNHFSRWEFLLSSFTEIAGEKLTGAWAAIVANGGALVTLVVNGLELEF